MFPAQLVYASALFSVFLSNEPIYPVDFLLLLLSCLAVWEILAEYHVIKNNTGKYTWYYRQVSPLARVLFWVLTIVLALAGWVATLV